MSYLGSWKIDDYLTFCCNTHDPDTGVATDADAVPTYRVYEDETGAAILNGNMAKLDDANTTGFYSERIQLTAANGIEKGKTYTVYISATVDTDTGTMHHMFQIEAEVDANTVSATNVSANMVQISGDGVAADNLESYCDGTTPQPVNATQIESGDATDAINAACDASIETYNLDHLLSLACPGNVITGAVVDNSVMAILAAIGGDISDYADATDSQEALADAIAGITLTADLVWDEEMDTNAPAACNTAREFMNVIISALAGMTAGTGDWSARDLGDTKTRLQGTLSAAGARSSIDTLDGT